jgi:hypothetical protein
VPGVHIFPSEEYKNCGKLVVTAVFTNTLQTHTLPLNINPRISVLVSRAAKVPYLIASFATGVQSSNPVTLHSNHGDVVRALTVKVEEISEPNPVDPVAPVAPVRPTDPVAPVAPVEAGPVAPVGPGQLVIAFNAVYWLDDNICIYNINTLV